MNPVYSFTVVMLVWLISDYVSKKSKSLLSSLLVSSLIFLVGFKTHGLVSAAFSGTFLEPLGNTFSPDLLPSSSLLALGKTIVGFIIVHLGTMISLAEFRRQSRTFTVGAAAVLGVSAALFLIGPYFKGINYTIAGIGALTGGTISIIIVQEAALEAGLLSVAVLPVLIAAFQGLVGFPLTSIILKKEAQHQQLRYRNGQLTVEKEGDEKTEARFKALPFMETTSGSLFWIGIVVLISQFLSTHATAGKLHPFVIALVLGMILRELGLFKANVLDGIDAFGLMMLGVLVIVFGPLAAISPKDLFYLIWPLTVIFLVGVTGNVLFSILAGKMMGYSIPMSVAIGLTSLYGFPGTMILSQEAAKSVGQNEDEIAAIEAQILPKMIIAGFSSVSITSVIITGFIVQFMG